MFVQGSNQRHLAWLLLNCEEVATKFYGQTIEVRLNLIFKTKIFILDFRN